LVNSQVPGLNTDESHQGPGGFLHQSTLDLEESFNLSWKTTVLISLVRDRSAALSFPEGPWALDNAAPAVRTTADPPVLFPAAVEPLVVGLHVH
jgi:hypothetical protein